MTSLSKENRLASRGVKQVFFAGKRQKADGAVFIYKKNVLLVSRFAVVVSLKIAKKNTARNKMRRQTKDIIRHMFSSFKKGYDIVIVFQSFFSKKKDIEVLFLKAMEKNKLLFS